MQSPDKINADTRILFGPTISNTCKSCAGFFLEANELIPESEVECRVCKDLPDETPLHKKVEKQKLNKDNQINEKYDDLKISLNKRTYFE